MCAMLTPLRFECICFINKDGRLVSQLLTEYSGIKLYAMRFPLKMSWVDEKPKPEEGWKRAMALGPAAAIYDLFTHSN